MTGHPRVLVAAPREADRAALAGALSPSNSTQSEFAVTCVADGESTIAAVRHGTGSSPIRVAFLDSGLTHGIEGASVASQIWDLDPRVFVVLCVSDPTRQLNRVPDLGDTERYLVIRKPVDSLEVRQIMRHLCARWAMEEEAKRTLTALECRNLDLDNAVRAAKEAGLAKSRFLANVSHEIRTPLHGILGLVTMLSDAEPTPQQSDIIELLSTTVNHLHGMLREVVDVARMESGSATLASDAVQVDAVILKAVEGFEDDARRKGIELHYEFVGETDAWVRADEVRLRQVLSNLVSNAVQHTEHGSVVVTVDSHSVRGGMDVHIEVSDTGPGIAPERLKTLFEPFERGPEDQLSAQPGSGLGLAMARLQIEMMGGEIGVRSESQIGSTFWIKVGFDRVKPSRAPRVTSGRTYPGRKVLLVEDNEVNVLVTKHLLARLEFETVDVARDGFQAVRAASEESYDLILMDCQMPGMDGFEASAIIHADQRDLPIVALTALATDEVRQRSEAAGMVGFLTKPLRLDMLVEVLDDLLLEAVV